MGHDGGVWDTMGGVWQTHISSIPGLGPGSSRSRRAGLGPGSSCSQLSVVVRSEAT